MMKLRSQVGIKLLQRLQLGIAANIVKCACYAFILLIVFLKQSMQVLNRYSCPFTFLINVKTVHLIKQTKRGVQKVHFDFLLWRKRWGQSPYSYADSRRSQLASSHGSSKLRRTLDDFLCNGKMTDAIIQPAKCEVSTAKPLFTT